MQLWHEQKKHQRAADLCLAQAVKHQLTNFLGETPTH